MIKLLVVDDSPLVRRLYGELFEAEGDFELSFARDGAEAIDRLEAVKPDVITLDVNMPNMDGLACLDRIMVERPTPVVMASSLTTEGAEEAVEALSLGAVDIIAKPGGAISLKMDAFGPALVEKVRLASQAQLPRAQRLLERVRARRGGLGGRTPIRRARPAAGPDAATRLVIIGASTGGPPALDEVLGGLPADFPCPILVAQHMPANFTGALARRLDSLLDLHTVEVAKPVALQPGCVYIARGDADMIVSERQGRLVALSAPSAPGYRWHPSVDRLVDSALDRVPANEIIGVLLTGMGNDGAAAMTRLHQGGGYTIAEAEESAVVWGMPGELVRAGGADCIAPLPDIAERLLKAMATP